LNRKTAIEAIIILIFLVSISIIVAFCLTNPTYLNPQVSPTPNASPTPNISTFLEPSINQSQQPTNQASSNATQKYEVTVYNFSSSAPESVVFGVSDYDFSLTIKNTGNVAVENITLEVNLTLSDGEKSNYYTPTSINVLNVGEVRQISGGATIPNVVVNLYGLHQAWVFVLRTPQGILTQQEFYS